MLQANSARVMELLNPASAVLDIGGWGHPFNRANYVLDCEPYETRGHYNRTFARNNPIPPIGGTTEFFDHSTWNQRDICEKTPFPFRDKEIDFVVCSHTLEDIRDPLWVCAEMIRVAKAGYIEVPSRIWETCRGLEPGIAGLSHHRWLIEIEGNEIQFLPKLHRVHNWRYSLPKKVRKNLSEEQSVQWLFWEDSFTYREIVLHGVEQTKELERFVNAVRPHPKFMLTANEIWSNTAGLWARAISRAHRMLAR
jgi:hypothetical protein